MSSRLRRGWQQFRRGRQRFRRWRRGRPFWGGLFLMLGGAQLFLSTQLDLMHVEISFGPEGFLALILPLVLLLCGILVWATPQHRYFYSIIGAVTAIYSLLGLNLGGWFLGMLFGILGGALGFAWTPVTAPEPRRPEPPPEEPTTQDLATGEPVTDERRGYLTLALPVLLAASLAVPAAIGPAASPRQCLIPIPLLCPEPPPPPDPTPEPSPAPSPEPSDPSDPAPDPSPSPAPEPDPDEDEDEPEDGEIPRLEPRTDLPLVSAEPAVMTATRLRQESFRFEGITEVETTAGFVEVLQFSFSRSTATNFTLTTTGDGDPAAVTANPLVLAGDVTFYTSRFSGRLLGIPLELTPRSPVLLLLELIRLPLDVTFTNVNLDLVFTSGAVLSADGFVLSV